MTVLERIGEQLERRTAEGDVENPAAYANRLATVFAQAEREAAAIRVEEQRETFWLILSTAEAERNSRTPERLREVLLEYWPGQETLVEKAVALVGR